MNAMTIPCSCPATSHPPQLVVLTGGPGAGKTAVLEVIRRSFCEHVAVLPEAASILFGGGFPRRETDAGRRAVQRAIYHVQRQLEALAVEEGRAAVVLCDRGTLDGLAYWPGSADAYWRELGTTANQELARYRAVIHLRTPGLAGGYDHRNPLRVESAEEAAQIDGHILEAWRAHPARQVVDPADHFLEKLARTLSFVRELVPACCRGHRVPELAWHRQDAHGTD